MTESHGARRLAARVDASLHGGVNKVNGGLMSPRRRGRDGHGGDEGGGDRRAISCGMLLNGWHWFSSADSLTHYA